MKRLIVAAVLLLLAGAVCAAGFIYTRATAGRIIDDITISVESLENGDKESALAHIKSAEDIWESNKPFLTLFIRHYEVHELDHLLSRQWTVLARGDYNTFKENLRKSISHLQNIRESEMLTLGNIF